MAGEQQRDRLVAHGARAERRAGIVGGAQQQPEHAAAGITAAAPFVDLLADAPVERAPRRDRPREWGPRAGQQL